MLSKNNKTSGIFISNNESRYRGKDFEKIRVGRSSLIVFFSIIWFFALIIRLYYIQILDIYHLQDKGENQHYKSITIMSERGTIFDRFQKPMAVSIEAPSVFVHPHKLKNKKEASKVLAKILSMDEEEILNKLDTKSPFVWIKRQSSRNEAEKILQLKDEAIGVQREFKRIYPYSRAASTLIGKVGTDGYGLSGLEAVFDKKLRGTSIKEVIEKDALGKTIKSKDASLFVVPKGEDISITIDADLQLIVDEEVQNAKEDLNAKAVIATMIDAYTGDILAMSQSSSINFNVDSISSNKDLKNLVIETVFEPGSIFKPIVAAIAYDLGYVKEDEMFDCENGKYYYGGKIIKDAHPSGVLSFRDVVIKSSNIGMVKIGDRLGKEKLYKALSVFGIGKLVDLDFSGQTAGIFRNYKNWAKVDVATHSFGQGVAVTSLQILRAIAPFVNGGYLPTLRLLKSKPIKKEKIIKDKTANFIKGVLIDVVNASYGTGKRARIENFVVGGKTGTAQKAKKDGRGYEEGKYIASFVGFLDTTDLNIPVMPLLIVNVDEANADSIYGGALAAPVFKKIMGRSIVNLQKRVLLN
ncbi:MAG: peptidoglycan D,D-transpeptidase FtsI family protein [Bdellovibrionota bacterium]